MRQVVGFTRAIERREAEGFYAEMCLHAAVAGGKVEKSFDEVYPDFAEQEEIAISPEAAKLIEKLAQQQLEDLKAGK